MSRRDFRVPKSSVQGLDDGVLCWAVVDPIWPDNTVKNELAHIAQGTPGQQAVYSTMLFAREVDNGGLSQFFGNSSGLYWRQVVEGLTLLNAKEQLAALSIALAIFPSATPSLKQAERQFHLKGITQDQKKSLKAADKAIGGDAGGVETTLLPLWLSYIRTHPEDFFLD